MTSGTGDGPRIVAAPITLVKRTITRLEFDGTPKGPGGPGASCDLDLSMDTKARPGDPDGHDSVEAILTVRSKPIGDAPFYSVSAEIRGLYEIAGDFADGHEGAERFVRLRGLEELYDFFRVVMNVVTTDGHYGRILLPTIAVAGIEQRGREASTGQATLTHT